MGNIMTALMQRMMERPQPANETDNDADGYVECTVDAGGWDGSPISGGEDCNDLNADFNPATRWFVDGDGDGFGLLTSSIQQCTNPEGYVVSSDDCDDTDATVYPGAVELCDGQYNNCTADAYVGDGAPADED